MKRSLRLACGIACLVAFWLLDLRAETIYVNNITGEDTYDGRAAEAVNEHNGPYRTIRHALERARSGWTVVLADTGEPYREAISVSGAQLGQSIDLPLRIVGNNAVISGERPLTIDDWTYMGRDLWRFSPPRKGWYLLLIDGRPAPEVPCAKDALVMPELRPGQWCAYKGNIYFQGDPQRHPVFLAMSYAAEQTGLTLYEARNVVITDLTIRHFRIDGISVQDRCRDVTLVNVHALENGRAGLAVGGSSRIVFRAGELNRNRRTDIVVTDLGEANVQNSVVGDNGEREP
jgi:hypothetical protein